MFELIVTLIPGLPLFAALANGLSSLTDPDSSYHRWYREKVARTLSFWATVYAFVASVGVLLLVIVDPQPREVVLYQWLAGGAIEIEVGFLVDRLSAFMMLIATVFPVPIARFANNYFRNEKGLLRFFTIKPMMLAALLLLVMGNNYLVCFLGWELVGVSMALLISYHYERKNTVRHGNKAVIMSRIGDVGFLLAIFMIATTFGTLNYTDVFAKVPEVDPGILAGIALCLLLAAMAKSAQLPFSTWLATAMEGPTPASALIHAAVQDGVYLIARNSAIFDQAPNVLLVVAIVGAATALFAGTVGLVQTHIKGILAYSTISQLGFMFLACGFGAYSIALFHMLTHAAVKTYLFLTSPSILHHVHGGPDLRRDGPVGLTAGRKLGAGIVLVAAVFLVAYAFISGYWPIQDAFSVNMSASALVLIALVIMGTFTTLYYSRRLLVQSFAHGHEEHMSRLAGRGGLLLKSTAVIIVLILAALGLGLLPGGVGGGWFQGFLGGYMNPSAVLSGPSTLLSVVLLLLLLTIVFSAWLIGLRFDRFQLEDKQSAIAPARLRAYMTVMNGFWLDEYYQRFIVQPLVKAGRFLDYFDSHYIDHSSFDKSRSFTFVGYFLQIISGYLNRIEAGVFLSAVKKASRFLLHVLAEIGNWLEERVLNRIVHVGVVKTAMRAGEWLFAQERKLYPTRTIILLFLLFYALSVIWIFGIG